MSFRQTPIHPTEIVASTIVALSTARGWSGLIVEHSVQPPNELDVPPLTAHLLTVQLASTFARRKPHQISRFGGHNYKGTFDNGNIFIVPAGVPSHFAWTTTDETIMISIEPDFLRRIAQEACEANPDAVELIGNPKIRDANIEQIARLLKNEIENEQIGERIYAESLGQALAVHLLRSHCAFSVIACEHQNGLTPPRLRRAVEYINGNLDQEIVLAGIAEYVGVSQYYFARLFKQSTGLAPHQYVLKQRVDRAKQLLIKSEVPLVEIGLATGFQSQSHFTRVFGKFTGMTPSKYREGERNGG